MISALHKGPAHVCCYTRPSSIDTAIGVTTPRKTLHACDAAADSSNNAASDTYCTMNHIREGVGAWLTPEAAQTPAQENPQEGEPVQPAPGAGAELTLLINPKRFKLEYIARFLGPGVVAAVSVLFGKMK